MISETERRVRRAALLAVEARTTESRTRVSDDVVDAVLDEMSKMSGREIGGLLYIIERRGPLPAAEEYDDKGYSEEKCLRCGWVMGHPPLNCNNDNTPHVFPSQLRPVDV